MYLGGYCKTTEGYISFDSEKTIDIGHVRYVIFTDEKVENHNKSMMKKSP
jgi:hypothetical protein